MMLEERLERIRLAHAEARAERRRLLYESLELLARLRVVRAK